MINLEIVYDISMILCRIVLVLTIIPLGIDEWKSFIERK